MLRYLFFINVCLSFLKIIQIKFRDEDIEKENDLKEHLNYIYSKI